MLAGLHNFRFSLPWVYRPFFLRTATMFPPFALLGGITLFSSAAAAVTHHQINVSNNTAGLIFDPPYIVRQPIIISDRCADSLPLSVCRGGRHCRLHLPPQEP